MESQLTRMHGPVSANRACELIRATYNHRAARDVTLSLDRLPTSSVHWNKEEPAQVALAPKDFKKWRTAWDDIASPVHRGYFLFCLLTGCRPGEAARIRRQDIDRKARTFTIPNAKAGKDITLPMTREIEYAIGLAIHADLTALHSLHTLHCYGLGWRVDGQTDGVFNLPGHRKRDVLTGLRVRYCERARLAVDILSADASRLPGPTAGQQTEQKISAMNRRRDVIPCRAPLLEVFRRERNLSGLFLVPMHRRSREPVKGQGHVTCGPMVVRGADQFAGPVSGDRPMRAGYLRVPRLDILRRLRHGVQRPLAPLRQDQVVPELHPVGMVPPGLALPMGLPNHPPHISRPTTPQ